MNTVLIGGHEYGPIVKHLEKYHSEENMPTNILILDLPKERSFVRLRILTADSLKPHKSFENNSQNQPNLKVVWKQFKLRSW